MVLVASKWPHEIEFFLLPLNRILWHILQEFRGVLTIMHHKKNSQFIQKGLKLCRLISLVTLHLAALPVI